MLEDPWLEWLHIFLFFETIGQETFYDKVFRMQCDSDGMTVTQYLEQYENIGSFFDFSLILVSLVFRKDSMKRGANSIARGYRLKMR